jgi:hypothetical protein
LILSRIPRTIGTSGLLLEHAIPATLAVTGETLGFSLRLVHLQFICSDHGDHLAGRELRLDFTGVAAPTLLPAPPITIVVPFGRCTVQVGSFTPAASAARSARLMSAWRKLCARVTIPHLRLFVAFGATLTQYGLIDKKRNTRSMENTLDGRRMFEWHAQGPRDYGQWEKDVNGLADAIAATAPIFNHNGGLVWLKDGKLIPVALVMLNEIIREHIVTPRLVNRDGTWTCEYLPFIAPDAAVRTMLTAEARKDGSLLARAPRA